MNELHTQDKVSKAIVFAATAHEGQTRKGSNIPYILHPLEAGIIASQLTENQDVICAAILHDVIEDTKETYESIAIAFGKQVADYVENESEDKSKTWVERKSATIEHLRNNKNREILIITLCDKLSNIRAMNRDYNAIGNELWNRFNVKDKSLHGWYYKGLLDSFELLEDTNAYSEYKELVTKVFG